MAGRIDNIVIKLAARCNLNCSYCYVYKHEDQSFRNKPRFISDETYHHALLAVRHYCARRDQHRMGITFHGGEPTLVGPQRFDQLAHRAKTILGGYLKRLSIQTNAVLIDDTWTEVLIRHKVHVGISLDGPADVHDLVRVDHGGKGSHRATLGGLLKLQQAGLRVFVLCVISPGQSGLRVYRFFRDLGITDMDFLLPDVSHDNKAKWYGQHGPTPIADYLLPIFDEWMREDDPKVRIRAFNDLLRTMMGGRGVTDAFGNPQMGYLIIETDGSIEALDALRVCEGGIQLSGLNIEHDGFDDLERGLPLVHNLVHHGIPVSPICEQCPERKVCGGGYLPHRYSRATGFNNPSVWCADILKLLAHMQHYV
ncbi:MAG: radical SAM protein [Candidatus Acidiferrales bacterium]